MVHGAPHSMCTCTPSYLRKARNHVVSQISQSEGDVVVEVLLSVILFLNCDL